LLFLVSIESAVTGADEDVVPGGNTSESEVILSMAEPIARVAVAGSRDRTELGVALADAVFGFRRVARRVVRETFESDDPLPPSEAELLALVGRAKGTSVRHAAQTLQLAPNTVSTLVSRLVESGLLDRSVDPADGRAAQLQLTPAGSARVRRWRRHRAMILSRALDALGDDERAALANALTPLSRLTEHLDALVPEEPR
jgi:DNA-binding MarR family transcriptional regulator